MPPCPTFTRTFYVSGVPLSDLYARAFYSAPARPSASPPPPTTPKAKTRVFCILWYVRAPRRMHTATLARGTRSPCQGRTAHTGGTVSTL